MFTYIVGAKNVIQNKEMLSSLIMFFLLNHLKVVYITLQSGMYSSSCRRNRTSGATRCDGNLQ